MKLYFEPLCVNDEPVELEAYTDKVEFFNDFATVSNSDMADVFEWAESNLSFKGYYELFLGHDLGFAIQKDFHYGYFQRKI